MTIQTRNQLKQRFQNGSKPDESDFANLIDSFEHKNDDEDAGTLEIASQAEAESGQANNKIMTPLRVAQVFAEKEKVQTWTPEFLNQNWQNAITYNYQHGMFQIRNGWVTAMFAISWNRTGSNANGTDITLPVKVRNQPLFGGNYSMGGFMMNYVEGFTDSRNSAPMGFSLCPIANTSSAAWRGVKPTEMGYVLQEEWGTTGNVFAGVIQYPT